jgi:selenocysteine lyase/cysteine desulfurase
MDWEVIRKEFPVLEKYTYLNPAGGSPMSLTAARAGKQYFDEMVAEGDIPYDRWLGRTTQVREKVAALIGATAAEVGFTMNTSASMNLIALMLKGKGEVLTMRDEFPSSTIPWVNNGFTVNYVDPVNYAYPVKWIEKHIGPETKILVSSAVQYCTGFRQDLKALGSLCRKYGLAFVVNATQAIGVMPIDVREAGIDYMAFSGLKWTTSGYGAGVMYVAQEKLNKSGLPFAGWQSTQNPNLMTNIAWKLRPEASVVEAGCPHFPSVFALGGALDLINRIGAENIHHRVVELNRLLQQRITNTGLQVIAPAEEKYRSGITIIKTSNARAIREKLGQKNIIVAARGEGVRVSVSFFNNETDIDRLITALQEIKEMF